MPVKTVCARTCTCAWGLLILLTTGGAVAAQTRGTPRLSMSEAVALALQNNDRIRLAGTTVESARMAHRAAHSAYRPKVVPRILGAVGSSETSNQSYGLDVFQRLRSGTELQATVATSSARNQLGTFFYSDTTISLSHPLYGGGAGDVQRSAERAAEMGVAEAVDEHRATEARVAIEVATSYYAIVSQQQVVAVAEKSLERYRGLLELSEAKLAIGRVSQLDVLRARQLVREAEGQVLDARAVAEDARDDLRVLTGGTVPAEFDVDSQVRATFAADLDPADVRIAWERRPELRRARAAVEEAERTLEATRRPLFPRVDLKLALTRRETADAFRSSFGLDGFRFVPFISISTPPDATAGSAREIALIQLQQRQRELAAAQRRIERDVRRALRQEQRLARGVEDALAAADLARQQVDVARARFDRGLSSNLDLVSAEADLLAAESRRIGAVAALAVARLSVKGALGTLDPAHDFTN